MSKDYIPGREADLVTFVTNFSTVVTAQAVSLGLTTSQATALASATSSFVSSYNVVHNGTTRSPANIQLKQSAKHTMIAMIRQLTGIIQKCPTVTNAQREALQITVPAGPSPIPVPAVAPVMDILSVVGRRVRVRIHSATGERRRKPDGVASAVVYSFVGATAPSDPNEFRYEGSTTRTAFEVQFPPTVAGGSQVWLFASWANPRDQTGPGCEPVSTYLQGGAAAGTA